MSQNSVRLALQMVQVACRHEVRDASSHALTPILDLDYSIENTSLFTSCLHRRRKECKGLL